VGANLEQIAVSHDQIGHFADLELAQTNSHVQDLRRKERE
jgi:hypothetical protein